MFVRGFSLDHGTDFSTRVEGMPVNIRSHAHGQGYTDMNFVVPELVEHIEYSLGGYYAGIGDFGSAGGASLRLRRSLDEPLFSAGVGENGLQRIVTATSAPLGSRGTLLLGGEYKGYDGPWELPEDLAKLSGMIRYVWQGAASNFSLLALGYDSSWNASDQIPLRGVQSGLLTRFGQIDQTLGGASSRYSVSGDWQRSAGSSNQRVGVYAIHYDLDLYSNFTYLLDNTDAGDQIRQRDRGRWIVGLNAAHDVGVEAAGRDHAVAVGLQLRHDDADVALSRTRERALVSLVRQDEVAQWSAGLYGQVESHWTPVFRSVLGLRGDAHGFDVTSNLAQNSGTSDDALVSPKLTLAFGPWAGTELYVSGGLGYHSNDARGTVQTVDPESGDPVDSVDPLVRSRGAEVGFRAAPLEGLRSTFAAWTVDLDSELLFVGDAGTTEAQGPSSRYGVTFANFYRMHGGWMVDFDVSFTHARFSDLPEGDNRIPNALENVVAAGITYEPEQGTFGAIRLRRFGSYPLVEDDSERASANALFNVNLGYRIGAARLTVSVLNLFNEEHSDIQYFYGSRLSGEPAGGVKDIHFHPAEPRQLRFSASWGM